MSYPKKMLEHVARSMAKAGMYSKQSEDYWLDDLMKEARGAIKAVREWDRKHKRTGGGE